MGQWEYKVVPTPRRPKRAKGVKGNSDRFAFALTEAINEVAEDGWEFVKTETLPMEAKPGLFKARVEVFQSLMVFRRAMGEELVQNQGDAGAILPVAAAAAVGMTAERYVAPTEDNQSLISAEQEIEVDYPPQPTTVDAAQEQVEAIADAHMASGQDAPEASAEEVEFDVGSIDPLKRVVEANRSGS